MKKVEDVELLQRIANHLIINSGFIDNLGLLHGKMGIVIFFYHYSRYNLEKIYHQIADEIMVDIINELHDELPIDLANGYCGIGWSIAYLLQNKFIEGKVNEVLEEIDSKIMERDVCRIKDYKLYTGFEGILHYVIFRLSLSEYLGPFDKKYIDSIYDTSRELMKMEQYNTLSKLATQYISWSQGKILYYDPDALIKGLIKQNKYQLDKITNLDLGIENGCAGIGLNIIFNEEKFIHIR